MNLKEIEKRYAARQKFAKSVRKEEPFRAPEMLMVNMSLHAYEGASQDIEYLLERVRELEDGMRKLLRITTNEEIR
jgi:hypothetical protein